MLKHWLNISLENYRRNLLSTAVNIFGLILGFAGFILVLAMWQYEKSFEQWNPLKKDIYYFQQKYYNENWTNNNMSYIISETALRVPGVMDYVLFAYDNRYGMLQTTDGKRKFTDAGQTVSEHFFNFFPFKLKFGLYENALNSKNKIAISEDLSKALFGNENPVGRQILFQDDQKLAVSAVYILPKENSVVKPEYLILSRALIDDRKNVANGFPNWGNNSYQALLKLKKGTDPLKIESQIFKKFVEAKYTKEYLAEGNTTIEEDLKLRGPNQFFLTRLDKARMEAPAIFRGHADTKNLKILLGLSVLILILSSNNLINLKTAQASQRAKEIGIKKAMGVSRRSIVSQLVFENFLLCIPSYILAVVMVELLLPYFNTFIEKDIEVYSWKVFGVSASVLVLVTLVSGFFPAIYISKFKPVKTLRGNFSRSVHGVWLRNTILVIQLGISFFFMVSAIVVFLQTRHIMKRNLGFMGDQIALISFNNSIHDNKKYEKIKTELSKIRGVKEVSFGEAAPLLGQSSSNVYNGKKNILTIHGSMDYNFFDFWGIKLLNGRKLSPKIPADTVNNVVVNEAFVNNFGWTSKEALGKTVQAGFADRKLNIVGVVKNYSMGNIAGKDFPIIFFHYKMILWKQNYIYNCLVKVDKNNIDETTENIKNYWNTVEPDYPFKMEFVNNSFKDVYAYYQKQIKIFQFLSTLVVVVAMLGLFALSTLLLSQMKKDIVVKKAIGATEQHLVWNFTRRFIWIILAAISLSIPATYLFISEWLSNFKYRIELPYWPFAAAAVLVFLLTLVVVGLRAWYYARIPLAENLKYE